MSCIDCAGRVNASFQRCPDCHREHVRWSKAEGTFSDIGKEARLAARLGVTFYRTPRFGIPERVA